MGPTLLVWLTAVIILLIVCGLALFGLRRADSVLARWRAGLLPRARQLSQEFSGLARRQPANPGEPYASRLVRAGKGIRRGWERARRVESALRNNPAQIPANPTWRLALIAPYFRELGEHLRSWGRLGWWMVETRLAENELEEARRRVKEIATLGKQEQSALKRLQDEIKTLQSEVNSHRLAASLSVEAGKLAELAERTHQASANLGENDPLPAQVAEAHPVRVQIEQELRGVRAAVHGHEGSHERLRPRLERQRERLEKFQQALSGEEARCPAPLLQEKTAAVHQSLDGLEAALKNGDYNSVETGLTELSARQKELDETLKKLSEARGRLAEALEQTGRTLDELQEWMQQFPAPCVLDTAQDQLKTLQARLQEQSRAGGSETIRELEEASKIALEEIRKTPARFERSLERYRRLAALLTPESVEGMQKRAGHLAARLKLRHTSYREKGRLTAMEEHLEKLGESWKTILGADPNRQSDLIGLDGALQQMETAWNEVERDTRRAMETLEQVKEIQGCVIGRLEDEAFGGLQPLSQQEDPQWGTAARGMLDQQRLLLERGGRGDQDYSTVFTEADNLQKAAAKLWKDYQFRVARTQLETTRLVEVLNSDADRLEKMVQHAYLDFDERAITILNHSRRWLGQAQTPSQSGLARACELVEQGVQLRMEAETLCRSLEAEVSGVEQQRAWCEDLLVTAEEYLGAARQQLPPNSFNGELGSARNLLELARRKYTALAAPWRKYLPAEYEGELADVRQMISEARDHTDHVAG